MELSLGGKAAIVTGSSRGIGRGIALALAAEGVAVCINCATTVDRGRQVVEEITAGGGRAILVQADVSDVAQGRGMVEETIKAFGRVDILVNNAGTVYRASVEDLTEEQYDDIMASNLKSCFFLSQAVVPIMRKQREGVIINITSSAERVPTWGTLAYAAAKAGMNNLTTGMAGELGPWGIRVVACSPGFITTERHRMMTPEFREEAEGRVPLGRFGLPEEMGAIVTFLVSPRAAYVTGTSLEVSGGIVVIQDQHRATSMALEKLTASG